MDNRLRNALVLLLNLALTGGLIALLNRLALPIFQVCIRSTARTILMALGLTLLINIAMIVVWRNVWLKASILSLCAVAAFAVITFWLGSYKYSPLGTTSGKYPVFQGFLVTKQGRVNTPVPPNELVLLQYGTPMGISVAVDLPDATCHWTSLNHAALDNPEGCDLVYSPPPAEYDILTVRVGSQCEIQTIRSQIKISIFP